MSVSQPIPCEKCGRYDAVEIGEHHLCVDCYEEAGSCCLEFGGDDLWDLEETRHPGSKP